MIFLGCSDRKLAMHLDQARYLLGNWCKEFSNGSSDEHRELRTSTSTSGEDDDSCFESITSPCVSEGKPPSGASLISEDVIFSLRKDLQLNPPLDERILVMQACVEILSYLNKPVSRYSSSSAVLHSFHEQTCGNDTVEDCIPFSLMNKEGTNASSFALHRSGPFRNDAKLDLFAPAAQNLSHSTEQLSTTCSCSLVPEQLFPEHPPSSESQSSHQHCRIHRSPFLNTQPATELDESKSQPNIIDYTAEIHDQNVYGNNPAEYAHITVHCANLFDTDVAGSYNNLEAPRLNDDVNSNQQLGKSGIYSEIEFRNSSPQLSTSTLQCSKTNLSHTLSKPKAIPTHPQFPGMSSSITSDRISSCFNPLSKPSNENISKNLISSQEETPKFHRYTNLQEQSSESHIQSSKRFKFDKNDQQTSNSDKSQHQRPQPKIMLTENQGSFIRDNILPNSLFQESVAQIDPMLINENFYADLDMCDLYSAFGERNCQPSTSRGSFFQLTSNQSRVLPEADNVRANKHCEQWNQKDLKTPLAVAYDSERAQHSYTLQKGSQINAKESVMSNMTPHSTTCSLNRLDNRSMRDRLINDSKFLWQSDSVDTTSDDKMKYSSNYTKVSKLESVKFTSNAQALLSFENSTHNEASFEPLRTVQTYLKQHQQQHQQRQNNQSSLPLLDFQLSMSPTQASPSLPASKLDSFNSNCTTSSIAKSQSRLTKSERKLPVSHHHESHPGSNTADAEQRDIHSIQASPNLSCLQPIPTSNFLQSSQPGSSQTTQQLQLLSQLRFHSLLQQLQNRPRQSMEQNQYSNNLDPKQQQQVQSTPVCESSLLTDHLASTKRSSHHETGMNNILMLFSNSNSQYQSNSDMISNLSFSRTSTDVTSPASIIPIVEKSFIYPNPVHNTHLTNNSWNSFSEFVSPTCLPTTKPSSQRSDTTVNNSDQAVAHSSQINEHHDFQQCKENLNGVQDLDESDTKTKLDHDNPIIHFKSGIREVLCPICNGPGRASETQYVHLYIQTCSSFYRFQRWNLFFLLFQC